MLYIVITEENSDLIIEPKTIELGLYKQWKQIRLDYDQQGKFWWEISDGDNLIYGFLHLNKQIISVEGNNEKIAQFLVWYRSIIPLQYPLYIFHDESDEDFELRAEDTEEELLKRLDTI